MGKASENKVFILFSGYNQRAVISFCRFAKRVGIPFYIISNGEKDTIHKTEYSNQVIKNRKGPSLDFDNITKFLSEFRKKEGIDELVILPSTEYLNRFLLQHKDDFASYNITIPLINQNIYKSISDKYSYYTICKEFGLPVPKEIDSNDVSFPMVIKPKRYFNGEGKVQSKPLFADSRSEFEEYQQELDLSDYFFQEFIDGPSYYLLFHISSSGNHAVFSQKNLVQQSEGGSMLAAVSSDMHKHPICDRYIELFEELDFHGLVMVELKKRDGQYYMIEANPRLWGPSQLFVDAGANIFERFVSELGFEVGEEKPSNSTESRYFWHGGLVEELSSEKELTFYNGYNKERFIRELPEWMNYEVYRKNDSKSIFLDQKGESSKSPKLK